MLTTALTVAFALVGAAFALSFLRLLKGPDAVDRILALDTLYINAIALLVLAGAAFTFIGSLGLYRLRDFYTRLHGPTKATTLGVGCLLVASSIFFSITGEGLSLHEILVTLFLLITAPISAHLLNKVALHRKLPSLAPPPNPPETPAKAETLLR